MATIVKCETCGGEVTAVDPEKYPYCRNCHYNGQADEALRKDTLAEIRRLVPDATVAVEHTGGGCFWLAVRYENDPKYYVLTDGDASLPTDDDGNPVDGGWGIVARYDDTETPEGLGVNDDYEGTMLHEEDPPGTLTTADAVALIVRDRSATKLYVANVLAENLLPSGVEPTRMWDNTQSVYEPPAAVGTESVRIQYGDNDSGVNVIVDAKDEDDAARRIFAAFGDHVTIDDLQEADTQ